MKETKLPTEDRLLPDTRLELLKDTLRYRFLDVVLLSILTGLFFLPLILWIVVATSLGLLDSSNIASVLLTYGIAILGFMIAGFGLGGTFYVCKKMAWGEGGVLGTEFLEGAVKNMGTSLALFGFLGILYFAIKAESAWMSLDETLPHAAKICFSGLSYGLFLLCLCSSLFHLAQSTIYEDRFLSLCWNSIKFLVGKVLTNIPVFLLVLFPFFLMEFLPYLLATILSFFFLFLFWFGFSAFVFTLYAHSLFDKVINQNQFPEIVRKGLRKH